MMISLMVPLLIITLVMLLTVNDINIIIIGIVASIMCLPSVRIEEIGGVAVSVHPHGSLRLTLAPHPLQRLAVRTYIGEAVGAILQAVEISDEDIKRPLHHFGGLCGLGL